MIKLNMKCLILQAMEHLKSFIADCDRKTEMAKRRLKETQEELSEEARAKVLNLSYIFITPHLDT